MKALAVRYAYPGRHGARPGALTLVALGIAVATRRPVRRKMLPDTLSDVLRLTVIMIVGMLAAVTVSMAVAMIATGS